MKVFIGITQNPQEADMQICQKFSESGGQTVVGPFMSSKEASDWMDFMIGRKDDYEQITLTSSSANGGTWYGITVEQVEVQAH